MKLLVTSEFVTLVATYSRIASMSLKRACDLGLTEYFALTHLHERQNEVRRIDLACALQKSPAAITACIRSLEEKGFIEALSIRDESRISITNAGRNAILSADSELNAAHERFMSALPANQRNASEIGAVITNAGIVENNRLYEGGFFAAFEMLHAVLVFEQYFTESSLLNNISFLEFRILLEVAQRSRPLRIGEISRSLLLKKPLTTYGINKLASAKLIGTKKDNRDKRVTLVEITPSGECVCSSVLEMFERIYRSHVRTSGHEAATLHLENAAFVVASLQNSQKPHKAP